jgi:hypothetical protein
MLSRNGKEEGGKRQETTTFWPMDFFTLSRYGSAANLKTQTDRFVLHPVTMNEVKGLENRDSSRCSE